MCQEQVSADSICLVRLLAHLKCVSRTTASICTYDCNCCLGPCQVMKIPTQCKSKKKLYISVFLCCYQLLSRKIREMKVKLNVVWPKPFFLFFFFSSGEGVVKWYFSFQIITYWMWTMLWILFWSSDISLLPPFRRKMRHARALNFICVTSSTLSLG